MKIETVLAHPSDWLRGDGPHHQIVISSRVRFARNIRSHAFPGWAKKAERSQILEEIKPRVDELPEMQDAFSEYMQELHGAGKAGAGRAPPHQPRARRQERRQRPRHQCKQTLCDHDQRGGPPADAGAPERPAAQERLQVLDKVDTRARGEARLRLLTPSSATSPPARPTSAPACAPRP